MNRKNIMHKELQEKYLLLKSILAKLDSVLCALSGGVDSGVLAAAAGEVLGGRAVGATLRSVLNPPGELAAAGESARKAGLRHIVLDFDPLTLPPVQNNAPDRCYHCKASLAEILKKTAAEMGLAAVVEGGNADDAAVHRPGARAVAEAGLRSPLQEAGLSKSEVRELARHYGLSNSERPAQSCLATRFPYGQRLETGELRKIFEAERLLAAMGLYGARARHHGNILRLELPTEGLNRLADQDFRERIGRELSELGFEFVTLDLMGYRSGVFDSGRRRV